MDTSKKTFVTQPLLPSLEEFIPYLEKIWKNKILTNNGAFHQQLEAELCKYLGVKHISLFCNGTIALITALQALKITGEVITTPYSFVASTHALWWNNIKPVFVDIEPDYFTLDPTKIEAAITPNTTAILPVHVYGNPCKMVEIQKIADTYGLKVIYDACHTFGVKQNNIPVLNFGDLSVMSFHATKVFNTFEGGAIVCHDATMKQRIDNLKNFGFAGETTVVAPGINAKMNEVQAAMGLLQLKNIDAAIVKRKQIAESYRSALQGIQGLGLLEDMPAVKHCYSYFPVFINHEKYGKSRDEVYELLKQHNIYGRRYFYPLISQFPTYRGLESAKPENLPIAERITEEVICLPIYPELEKDTIVKICKILMK
jgi:dTDP-4-amino-4,6-dideoxygalactose transaminase